MRLATLTCAIFLLAPALLQGQCPLCDINYSCGDGVEFPSVCPQILPSAVAGEYYEESLTFYMPETFQDPESGVDVELIEVYLESLLGLPYGLEVTLDEEDGIYEPQEGQQYGCASVCGIPLLAGSYIVDIEVIATVLIFGSIETEAPQSFSVPFLVEPGENANQSFAYSNLTSCDSLLVSFEALVDGSPNPTYYSWDFDNGNTSDQALPPDQLYNEAGEYTVSLSTEITHPILNGVELGEIGSGWGNDADELSEGFPFSPDPYFVIADGDGSEVYTSTTFENEDEVSWSEIELALDNPPYSIAFLDYDQISEDDELGAFNINLEFGTSEFADAGTEGNYTVDEEILQSYYNEEIVFIFPSPNGNFQVDEEAGTLYYSDPELTHYGWFLNGFFLPTETDSIIEMTNPGVYTAVVENLYGCQSESGEYVECPEVEIDYNSSNHQLSVDGDFLTYQWYLNDELLEGEINSSLIVAEDGNYSVQITTSYGCEVFSEALFISLGIGQQENLIGKIKIYPNPAFRIFTLEIFGLHSRDFSFSILDNLGRTIYKSLPKMIPANYEESISLENISPGHYFLKVHAGEQTSVQRLIVK